MVSEKLFGPIDVTFMNSRCNFEMKNCEKASTFNFKELCKKMIDPLPLYSKVTKNIQPPLKCPIEAGNYTIMQSVLDFSIAAHLPIDGYV